MQVGTCSKCACAQGSPRPSLHVHWAICTHTIIGRSHMSMHTFDSGYCFVCLLWLLCCCSCPRSGPTDIVISWACKRRGGACKRPRWAHQHAMWLVIIEPCAPQWTGDYDNLASQTLSNQTYILSTFVVHVFYIIRRNIHIILSFNFAMII